VLSLWSGLPMTEPTLYEEVIPRRPALPMNLLIVDDEEATRELCATVAAQVGLRATGVPSAELALEVLEQSAVDILLVDLKLPGMSGLELLKRVTEVYPQVSVLVLTQYGTIDSAIEATRIGARDYVTKPFRIEELRTRLDRAIQAVDLQQENRLLREQLNAQVVFGSFVGASEKMRRVYRMIEKVGPRNYSVLILGESGTGKELVARAVHSSSLRKSRPFVPVDCSAITPTLIESELFGYVKGAFTGAMQSKQGLLEAANGGTLFLDEIGEMPVEMQAKLLRVLQEREVKPVGATERRQIDVRIVAATNRDLEAAVKCGSFRQDLYFRLNVVQIKLPPLRERKTDIPFLVAAFLEKYAPADEPPVDISEDAMRTLMAYDWPGNVRELENAITRSLAYSSGKLIHVADLPSNLHHPPVDKLPQKDEIIPLEELERRAIMRTLRETNGDKVAASRILGIGKTTLYRKLKQYNVVPLAQ
jgi:DNA-binding NtrC family response regulator